MDKVITRGLLRTYYNGIKPFLKPAEDSEINAIVDGISFDDLPQTSTNRFPINAVYVIDYKWTFNVLAEEKYFSDFKNLLGVKDGFVKCGVYFSDGSLFVKVSDADTWGFNTRIVSSDANVQENIFGISGNTRYSWGGYGNVNSLDDAYRINNKISIEIMNDKGTDDVAWGDESYKSISPNIESEGRTDIATRLINGGYIEFYDL